MAESLGAYGRKVTKQQVMRSLGFGVSRFFYWAKSCGIEPIQIGKVCLIPAKPVVLAMGEEWVGASKVLLKWNGQDFKEYQNVVPYMFRQQGNAD